jgi:hypothetical protein
MNPPIAADVATAEPDIEPNNIADTMWTKANPPGNIPTSDLAKAISRLAIPPLFISCPERMKKGMAKRAKLSRPVAMRWATVVNAGTALILKSMVVIVAIPMLKEIGTPMQRRKKKLSARTRM